MSTTEPLPETPTPPAQSQCRRGRGGGLRRFFVVSALLLTGGLIGAFATTASHGFGPGGHHGIPAGWYYFGGDDGPGGWGGGPRTFFPGRIERRVERVLHNVDASSEQQKKITATFQKAADDIFALRAQHLEGRKQIREALAAPTIDRARIDSLRTEQMKLADTAAKRLTDALIEAAEVLTPAQRTELSNRVERWERWFRG
jgi:Spy/CpxP family protein refolding chaperone